MVYVHSRLFEATQTAGVRDRMNQRSANQLSGTPPNTSIDSPSIVLIPSIVLSQFGFGYGCVTVDIQLEVESYAVGKPL